MVRCVVFVTLMLLDGLCHAVSESSAEYDGDQLDLLQIKSAVDQEQHPGTLQVNTEQASNDRLHSGSTLAQTSTLTENIIRAACHNGTDQSQAGSSWASLEPSDFPTENVVIKFQRGCTFDISQVFNNWHHHRLTINGLKLGAYGSGPKPVLAGAAMVSGETAWGLAFKGSNNVHISNLVFQDSSLHFVPTWGQTMSGFTLENCVFDGSDHKFVAMMHNTNTNMAYKFENVLVQNNIFRGAHDHAFVMASWAQPSYREDAPYSSNITFRNNHFYDTACKDGTVCQGAGVVVNSATDILFEHNVCIRMYGSCYWSVRTKKSTYRNNFVAWSKRITDSFTGHVDIYNLDLEMYGNIGYKNEGGFFEILGWSNVSTMQYSISIDDAEDLGSDRGHKGAIMWASDYSGPDKAVTKEPPHGIYMMNNLIMTSHKQYYGLKGRPSHVLYANNVFFGPWDWPPLETKTSPIWVENRGGKNQKRHLVGNVFAGPHAGDALFAINKVFNTANSNKVVDTNLSSLLDALSTELDTSTAPQGANPRLTAEGFRDGSQNVEEIRRKICRIIKESNYGSMISSQAPSAVQEFSAPYQLPTHDTTLTDGLQPGAQVIDFCGFKAQWPILGPIGSTITLPCQEWCAGHSSPWGLKCSSFKNCKGCLECKVQDPGPL